MSMAGRRIRRVVYAAGPGDVARTYRFWRQGDVDRGEVAATYSGQFFDVCHKHALRAWVLGTCARGDRVRGDRITIHQEKAPLSEQGGLLFHVGEVWQSLRIVLLAWRVRADAVVAGALTHWWPMTLLRLSGTRVIPSLHCAFWPMGCRPRGRADRLLQWLNGRFWRMAAAATIAVSPECARQVREICSRPLGPVHQSRAYYPQGVFAHCPEADPKRRPFVVMYAGRIETNKGVFESLDVAASLQRRRPGEFRWVFCGTGGAIESLRDRAREHGLEQVVSIPGALDQEGMVRAYRSCHVVITPTTHGFAEGLNKVAVEAVLATRPVLASRFTHALEVLGEAAVEIDPGDISGFARAIEEMADHPERYRRRASACQSARRQFSDPSRNWAAALERALALAN